MKNRITALALPSNNASSLLKAALLCSSIGMAAMVFGQGKGAATATPQLRVEGQVMTSGAPAEGFEVSLYQDNVLLRNILPGKNGRFQTKLEMDRNYSIIVSKPGHQPKLIAIDSTVPKDEMAVPVYDCLVNLAPETVATSDGFFADFPNVIVRWDPELKGFHHSEHYIAHMQTRLGGIAAAGN